MSTGFNCASVSGSSFQNVQHLRVVARELTTFCETIPDCGDRPLDIWKFCGIDGSISKLVTENEDWQSLTHLVKNLPALRKLTWACLEQIPPCILNTIDEKTPRCWLYMENFCLRSLVQPLSAPLNIESKDLNVATAQFLRSIVMRRDFLESSEYTDYNPQAVMEMVSGGAPNLQAVSLLWPPGAGRLQVGRPVMLPTRSQNSTFSSEEHQKRGHLQSLEIAQGRSGQSLMSWNTITDFGLLQSLKVNYLLVTSDFRWLKDNCRFNRLHTLAVNLGIEDGEHDPQSELTDAVESFLWALPPLRSVKLTGDYSRRIVESILSHCGLSSICLLLGPIEELETAVLADISLIKTVQHKCQNLEELAIPLMRRQGNASEVAVYRSLAHIPALRRLHLSMYCAEPFLCDQNHQSPRGLDSRMSQGDQDLEDRFCRAAIDLAIDQALVASIFEIFTKAKALGSPALESLEIRVEALRVLGGFSSTSKLVQWLQYLGRSWTCTPETRDDMCYKCRIVEYDNEEKLDRDDIDELGHVDEEIRTRFSRLLPKAWQGTDGDGWKTQWHGFPLDASPNDVEVVVQFLRQNFFSPQQSEKSTFYHKITLFIRTTTTTNHFATLPGQGRPSRALPAEIAEQILGDPILNREDLKRIIRANCPSFSEPAKRRNDA
ncbi:hypothetical protein D6D20_08182 [Aureobasidium pullulans]|uniref:Uncharacterized protein n=1 Tax=Aureobasidium pullulans TaxID=5580 RepID=A0A4S8Z1M4_AURPU|nr:hypothetical protein D6D20_08182 [Aureobasidium pullulans]